MRALHVLSCVTLILGPAVLAAPEPCAPMIETLADELRAIRRLVDEWIAARQEARLLRCEAERDAATLAVEATRARPPKIAARRGDVRRTDARCTKQLRDRVTPGERLAAGERPRPGAAARYGAPGRFVAWSRLHASGRATDASARA